MRAPEFIAEAHRQSVAIAMSKREADDQAFVDAISTSREAEGEEAPPRAPGAYTGKPRLVVILQDDRFDATASITVCPFTTNPVEAPLLRLKVHPSEENGLDQPIQLVVDKLTTVLRTSLGERVGGLPDDELVALNRSLIVFLGVASTPPTRPRRRNLRLLTARSGTRRQECPNRK